MKSKRSKNGFKIDAAQLSLNICVWDILFCKCLYKKTLEIAMNLWA